MNRADTSADGLKPSPCSHNRPSGATTAGQGEGRGTCRAAAANSVAWAEGAGGPTGRSSRNVPCSGTQISLQTSHCACATTWTSLPPTWAGRVTLRASSTVPV